MHYIKRSVFLCLIAYNTFKPIDESLTEETPYSLILVQGLTIINYLRLYKP